MSQPNVKRSISKRRYDDEIEFNPIKQTKPHEEDGGERENGSEEAFTYCPSITAFHVDPSHSWTPRWRGRGVCARKLKTHRLDYISPKHTEQEREERRKTCLLIQQSRPKEAHKRRNRETRFSNYYYYFFRLCILQPKLAFIFLFFFPLQSTHRFVLVVSLAASF